MDRFEAMSILLQAVEKGSLSAAGRQLGLPLATISRKISDLETHLKTRLLVRGGRKLVLTDAGARYLEACRRIVDDVIATEREAAGEYRVPTGELVMTAPIVFGRTHLLPIITDFLGAYPDIQIRLIQSDRVVSLIDEHVDVAARIGALPDSALIATRVGLTHLVACASPAYLAAHGTPTTPDELAAHACISFEPIATGDQWTFRVGGIPHAVSIRPRLKLNTAEAAVEAAVAGLGIARVTSYQTEQACAAGHLKLLLEQYEPPTVPISLVYPSQRQLPLKLRAFLDFAVPRLRLRLEPAVDAAR